MATLASLAVRAFLTPMAYIRLDKFYRYGDEISADRDSSSAAAVPNADQEHCRWTCAIQILVYAALRSLFICCFAKEDYSVYTLHHLSSRYHVSAMNSPRAENMALTKVWLARFTGKACVWILNTLPPESFRLALPTVLSHLSSFMPHPVRHQLPKMSVEWYHHLPCHVCATQASV